MWERLGKFWTTVLAIMVIVAIGLSINQIFHLGLFGINLMFEGYLYFLIACFLPLSFIIWPIKKSEKVKKVQWFDSIFFLISLLFLIYLGFNVQNVILMGWETSAPLLPTIGSVLLWIAVLEGVRRAGGLVLMIVCLVFSLFPVVADKIPISFLQGIPFDFLTTATNHIMSQNSLLGTPIRTMGELLVGFLIFGIVLVHTGGGDFFFKLANGIFGRSRGGTAKVAVLSSAFFGMLSGSAVSNVVTTGTMTIPAMKKSGFPNHYAAAVEATAATGGTITPPIMGSAAFIMAAFLAIPYSEIAIAAAIPAFLYYVGIIVQVDGYAAMNNLTAVTIGEEMPPVWKTLKEGWFYVFAIFLLVFLLIVTKNETQAPYYVSIFLILVSFIRKETRLNLKKTLDMILEGGKLMAEMTAILAAVGFVVGALSITGVAFSFSRELVAMAGDVVILILIAGAITSFILGMGVTVSAVYIFLAIVMAPALVSLGVDPVGAHLFVIYWATVSYITPPVALAAYAASGIANASPLKTSFTAMRLGSIKYFVPFFWVYNPALIARGEINEVVVTFIFAVLGVWWLSSAWEGYLAGYGKLSNLGVRIITGVSGLLVFFPQLLSSIIGVMIMLVIYGIRYFSKKSKASISA